MEQKLKKLYIPPRANNFLVEQLPVSDDLKELFDKHNIRTISDLQTINEELLDKIFNSSEKPFSEMRLYILAIQESESGKIILISSQDSDHYSGHNDKDSKNQNEEIEFILSKTIFIPLPAREWRISNLPMSFELGRKLLMSGCSVLEDIHGIKYARFSRLNSFEEKDILDLYGFLTRLQSESVFRSIKAQIAANIETDTKNTQEDKLAETTANNVNYNNSSQHEIVIEHANLTNISPLDIIETPANLRNLPTEYLAPSDKLTALLKKINVTLLGQLYGFYYYRLGQRHGFDDESLLELKSLIEFAKKFAKYGLFSNGFENIRTAAIKRRESEDLVQENPTDLHTTIQNLQEKQQAFRSSKLQINYEVKDSPSNNFSDSHPSSLNSSKELLPQSKAHSKKLSLSETIIIINELIFALSIIEKEVIIYRFGGSANEEILTFEAIAQKNGLSRERVYPYYMKILNRLKNTIGESSKDTLEKLYEDCLRTVCPLTPKFLVHLMDNNYGLFQYPPGFYIRILGILHNKIPVLVENVGQPVNLEAGAKKIEQEIKFLLEKSPLPVSLLEIFNRLISFRIDKDTAIKDFFTAIKSERFNLIQTNKPDELYIELK